ncbi:hypothetical protein JG688_00005338, partial [Phytophthora aleatoria]
YSSSLGADVQLHCQHRGHARRPRTFRCCILNSRSWWRSHLITLQHGDLARELESARGELFHGWHRHFAVLPQV